MEKRKTQELKILYFRSNYFFTRVVETTDAHFVIVPDNNSFDFLTGLRGYYVYRNIWKPYVRQNISFRQERDNEYDRFAVCGLVNIPGKIE